MVSARACAAASAVRPRQMEEASKETEHKIWCDMKLSTNGQTKNEKTVLLRCWRMVPSIVPSPSLCMWLGGGTAQTSRDAMPERAVGAPALSLSAPSGGQAGAAPGPGDPASDFTWGCVLQTFVPILVPQQSVVGVRSIRCVYRRARKTNNEAPYVGSYWFGACVSNEISLWPLCREHANIVMCFPTT